MKTTLEKPSVVLVIHYDNCDPDIHGPFKNVKRAEKRRDEITAKWSERDWYHAGNGHGITVRTLQS